MSERDPRVDPQPGDVLWAGQYFGHDQSDLKITRTVLERKGYGHVRHTRGTCELETWQRWAKGAEVVKRG